MTKAIRVVRLLPDLLALNGSRGNAEVIATRLGWWDFAVELVDCTRGQSLPSSADLVVIGQGTSSLAGRVGEALQTSKSKLLDLYRTGTSIVAIGLGGDLLGRQWTASGEQTSREGLGLTDVEVVLTGQRFSGEVTGKDYRGETVAGYLNDAAQRSATEFSPVVTDLSPSTGSWQGATANRADGVFHDRLWVSTLSGPLLALNPGIADHVIETVLAQRGIAMPAPTANHRGVDGSAEKARRAIELRIAQRR